MNLTYTVMVAGVTNKNRAEFTEEGIIDALDKYWGRDSHRPIVRKKMSGDEQVLGYVGRKDVDYDKATKELRVTLPAMVAQENVGSYIIPIINIEREGDRKDGSIIADSFVISGFLLTTTDPAFVDINNKIV